MKAATLRVVLASGLAAAPAFGQWTGIDLYPSSAMGNAVALCAAGTHQGGWSEVGGRFHAALWSGTAGSYVDLHPMNAPGVTVSQVLGMSPTVQVGYTFMDVTDNPHAAIWFGSAASWVDLNPPDSGSSAIYATNGGVHVGRVFVNGNDHAAAWSGTSSGWQDLNPLFASSSYAFAISGSAVVGYVNFGVPLTSHAGMWDAIGSFVDLNPAGADGSFGFGIDGGEQVGYEVLGFTTHAVVWHNTAASVVDLNPSPSVSSHAYAVHGGMQVGEVNGHAALWTGTAASRVDLHPFLPPEFLSSAANAIWTDNGTTYIAGQATAFTGALHPVLWTMGASPACYSNCDGSTTLPILNVNDFICFQSRFAAGDSYANCDGSTTLPVLNVNDFICFLNSFATGCSAP